MILNNIEEDIRNYIAKNILFSKSGFPYADTSSLLQEGVIDSMNVLELVMFVEENYDVMVEDEDIVPDNFDSIAALAAYIRQKHAQGETIKPSQKKNKGMRPALGEAGH